MDDYNCRSQSDRVDESDQDDLEENEDGNYTVYECPGLAPVSMRNTQGLLLYLYMYTYYSNSIILPLLYIYYI